MIYKYDKWWTGMLAGFLAPLIAFLIYYQINYGHMGLLKYFRFIINGNMYSQLMSLCVIANLPFFFLFLQFNMYNSSRGVILMTIIYAVSNFILKLV